jgi:hypothetical protein
MKLRNISFLERHVEKFALLLAVLILAGVGYLYWVKEPYAVQMGRQTVTPRTVDREIKNSADQLNRRLQEDKVGEELANLTVPEYTESFKERVQQPLLNTSSFRVAVANPPGFDAGTGPDSDEPFHVPSVPTPALAAARGDLGSIEPEEVRNSPQFANNYFDSTQAPYDTAWVSLLGQFDLKAMEEELSRNPNTGQALPTDWWERTFAIVEVEAERQRRRPDGTWPKPDDPDYSEYTTSVRPMPGRLSFDIPETVSSSAAGGYLRMIQQNQLAIVQPSFYSTLNRSWRPPQPDQEYGDEEERMQRIIELKNSIASKENQINGMERRIERLNQSNRNRSTSSNRGDEPPDMARGPQGSSGGGSGMRGSAAGGGSGTQGSAAGGGSGMRGSGGGPGGGGSEGGRFDDFGRDGSGGSGNNRTQDPRQRQLERAQQRMQRAQDELDELRQEFYELTRLDSGDDTSFGRRSLASRGGRSSSGRGMRPDDRMMERQMMMDEQTMRGSLDRSPRGGNRNNDLPQQRLTPEELDRITSGESLEEQDPMEQEQQMEQRDRDTLGRLSLDPPTLDLWVNDMYVEPGQTYRYRIRLSVVNPLFNKEELPEEQREDHEDRFLLYSDWSDWSREISVEPMRHFFMTSASQTPAPGRANVQVWRFFSGSWESSEFRVQPGDPIGMTEGLSVSDLLEEAEDWEQEQERQRQLAESRDRSGMRGSMRGEMEMMGPGRMEEEMMRGSMGPGAGAAGPRSGSGRGTTEEQQRPETLAVGFFTGNYLVDIDFVFPIPGQFGNRPRTTERRLYLDENENLKTMRLDQSRRDPKIEWLQARRDILGPPDIEAVLDARSYEPEQTGQASR